MNQENGSVLDDLRAKQDMITKNSSTVPVARLDCLDSKGNVGDSREYFSEEAFLKALQDELYYGVPLIVVLYRNEKGKTISKDFLEDLDTLPKWLEEEDAPKVQSRKSTLEKGAER